MKVCERGQRGAVLLLGLFLIVGLCFFAVLGIDVAMILSADMQAQNTARLASLAAAQGYYSERPREGETAEQLHKRRLIRARDNAQAVVGRNKILKVAGANTRMIAERDDLGPGEILLIPGSYKVLSKTDSAEKCTPPNPIYPRCFFPYDKNNNSQVTAFFIKGLPYEPVLPLFRKHGSASVSLKVQSVATVVPRLFSILLDRSTSTAFLSHTLQDNRPQWWASSFSYRPYDWAALQKTGARGSDGLPSHPKRHYFTANLGDAGNDYRSITVDNDAEYLSLTQDLQEIHPNPMVKSKYSSASVSGNWIVDGYRDSVVTGPEPFGSILQAFSTALDAIEKTIEFGDRVSLIPFSDRLFWSHVVTPTKNVSHLREYSTLTVSPLSRAVKYGMFPTYDSQLLEFTNAQLALAEFKEHLDKAKEEISIIRGVPIVITDGLHNCRECHDSSPHCINGFRCVADTYDQYVESMQSLNDFIDREVQDKFAVNVILFGPGAHIRNVVGKDKRGCLSDDEALEKGIFPYTQEPTLLQRRANFIAQRDGKGAFLASTFDWFKISMRTGGLFVSVRAYDPACNERCDGNPTRPIITCSSRTAQQQVLDAFNEVFLRNSYRIPTSE